MHHLHAMDEEPIFTEITTTHFELFFFSHFFDDSDISLIIMVNSFKSIVFGVSIKLFYNYHRFRTISCSAMPIKTDENGSK